MPRLELSAGPIDYRIVGPADGAPVLFVHGFLVDGRLWSDVPDRLAEHGFRCLVPTWPLGAHTAPMRADADLSPAGVARIVVEFLDAFELTDATLVGNDTGGAICQLAVNERAERIGGLVLTNCDAFEVFPPFPFNLLFRLGRHPRLARLALGAVRWQSVRHSPLGYGLLTRRPMPAELTLGWVEPYLTSAEIRRDVAAFARGWSPRGLVEASARMAEFDRPALLAWGPEDRLFRIDLGRRLARTLPRAHLVEIRDALTFVPQDQPARLAEVIAQFLSAQATVHPPSP
ncbi:MAG: alpha/beta hydrolase [Dermatophilaceae bacterium]